MCAHARHAHAHVHALAQHVPQHVDVINNRAECVWMCGFVHAPCSYRCFVLSDLTYLDLTSNPLLTPPTTHPPSFTSILPPPHPSVLPPCTVYCICLHPSFPSLLPLRPLFLFDLSDCKRMFAGEMRGERDRGRRGEGGEKKREEERKRGVGGRDCALSCRESHGVPDWRKMSGDCSPG